MSSFGSDAVSTSRHNSDFIGSGDVRAGLTNTPGIGDKC
jgi:hypothetical protein